MPQGGVPVPGASERALKNPDARARTAAAAFLIAVSNWAPWKLFYFDGYLDATAV